MRPRRAIAGWIVAVAGAAGASAAPPPASPPDEDFLAYLGSWDGDDSDWQVVQESEPSPPARPAASAVKVPSRPATAEGAARTAQESKP